MSKMRAELHNNTFPAADKYFLSYVSMSVQKSFKYPQTKNNKNHLIVTKTLLFQSYLWDVFIFLLATVEHQGSKKLYLHLSSKI